jgi:signal transduction histidine kinase
MGATASRPSGARDTASSTREAEQHAGGPLRQLLGSVRFRVTALATLAVLAVLVATSIGLVTAERRSLSDNLRETIAQRADELAEMVASNQLPPALVDDEDTRAQIVTLDGRVLSGTPSLLHAIPISPPPPGQAEVLRTVRRLPTGDGAFRVLSRRVVGPHGPVVIHVAGALDDVQQSSRVLATGLAISVPAVTILLAALVWQLVGRTLRPVEALRAEVAHISGDDLAHRVPQPAGDDEIAQLARTMNRMLDRVEQAAARQRRFVADASHELRSPLTRIRSELEVDLAHPDTADPTMGLRSALDEIGGLQRLVEDLLQLARSDAGVVGVRGRLVDLDDIVLREAGRLCAAGRVKVDCGGVSAAQVVGDGEQLARVVRNLADNAARYARQEVRLTLAEVDHRAVLTVADDGPGIAPQHHARVFERFTRLDQARSASTGGVGLGLAIVADIVQRHHGTITIDPQHRPGARFIITLPTTPEAAEPAASPSGARRPRGHAAQTG